MNRPHPRTRNISHYDTPVNHPSTRGTGLLYLLRTHQALPDLPQASAIGLVQLFSEAVSAARAGNADEALRIASLAFACICPEAAANEQ